MTQNAGRSEPIRRLSPAAALAAAALVVCLAGAAGAQDGVLVPVAPPEDAELAYNIPLPEWMMPEVLELKTEFSDGLAAEFSDIAENQTGGGVRTLVKSGEQLAEGASRLGAAITSISEIDVTFGIDGISRIIPAEGALRDTLFGFVVWHETSTKNSQGLMKTFEDLVEAVVSGGNACGRLAAQLSSMETQLNDAIAAEDMDTVAALAPSVVETSTGIDAVCRQVAGSASELMALVDELSIDSGAQLMERWTETRSAVAQCAEPAHMTGEANASVSEVLYLMIELGRLLDGATGSVRALEAATVEDGMAYIPWTVMRDDWRLVQELEERILDGDTSAAGHATQETKQKIRSLYVYQVEANRILAHRAVEYTSMVVGGAMDRLEAFYKVDAHYDPSENERRQREAFAKVDEKLRENLPLVAARMSAGGARAALEIGDKEAALGPDHEINALHQYHNAWLHSLNAGSAAQRSVLEIYQR
ncbi:MAG: hypothetical protein JXB46_06885 [Candidatus Eisenbacteria bacterium]|nr:hypothetical protein [Candidatus Eisenbacteria bacterium]